ncbi:MAG TPA: PP2C family protein-serine/threonine phosphatase [Thermoanaerobaculia bacterium]
MTAQARANPFVHSPAELLRELTISILIGLGVVFLVQLGESSRPTPGSIAYGAMIGSFAYIVCLLLGASCGGWISRIRVVPERLARSVLYFVGGGLGWLLATVIANASGLVRVPLNAATLRLTMPIAGAITLIAGLSLYAYSVLRDRLEQSVTRLKDAEFAEKELELARSIQQRILPPAELAGDGYRISARNLAARFVAGDFYDVFQLPDGAVGIVVADVAGKGVGASLVMATVKTALPFLAAERSVAETLREANRRLKLRLEAREFVALAFARYEPKTGAFDIANAGLPDAYLVGRDGSVRAVSGPGPRYPLGVRGEVPYESVRAVLAPGERLVLLTDGLPEAPMPSGEPLGYERLEQLLSRAASPDALLDAVRSATSATLADDWTVLVIERAA